MRNTDFDITVEGLDELILKLEQIGNELEVAEVTLAALKKGGEILRDAAAENAPGKIVMQQESNPDRAKLGVSIGFLKKNWYFMFFETGAGVHEIEPKNKRALMLADGSIRGGVINHPGIPARPFLRPALDNRGDEAARVVMANLWAIIEKVMKEG